MATLCYQLEQEQTRAPSTSLPAEPVGGKRKRMDDEGGKTAKVARKQRGIRSEENISTPEPETTKRGGRPRRTQRSKRDEEEKEKSEPSTKAAATLSEDDSVVVLDDLTVGEDTVKKGEGAKM